MSAVERELEAIEDQYRGQPFDAMPPAVQECWSELFQRSEEDLLDEIEWEASELEES